MPNNRGQNTLYSERSRPVAMPSGVPRRERLRGGVLGQLVLQRPRGGMAQLCGPGRDAESGFHHRLLPAERHHASARHPDGQVWTTPHPSDGKVKLFGADFSLFY